MDPQIIIILTLAIIFGLYMAWGIGANDVANAMGTSVGSGALTLRRAVIIAAVFEFSGAVLVGTHVSETVRKGIVDPALFTGDGLSFMLGMLASLLAAGVWLQIASYKGWPVSTTHSIVGAVVGFGVVYGGVSAIHWDKVGMIAASWIISPLLAGTLSYLIFRLLLRRIFYGYNPLRSAKKLAPYIVFCVFVILTLTLVFKGLKNMNLDLGLATAFALASAVGLVASLVSAWLVSRMQVNIESQTNNRDEIITDPAVIHSLQKAAKHLERVQKASTGSVKGEVSGALNEVRRLRYESERRYRFHTNSAEYQQVEKLFVYLQILSASFVAFAHGANDVANAIGPMSAVISVALAGGESVAAISPVPLWVLGLGGLGIVVGLATWGWRVMETVGRNITQLTPTRGFSAEIAAALTIILASKLGLPISTTHTLVGAVVGVGLARGISAVNLITLRDVVMSWFITLPAGASLAIVFFFGLRAWLA
jgi:inorganic phosphate transporter, PiT family